VSEQKVRRELTATTQITVLTGVSLSMLYTVVLYGTVQYSITRSWRLVIGIWHADSIHPERILICRKDTKHVFTQFGGGAFSGPISTFTLPCDLVLW
jgi:hypothetical protein